MTTTITPFDIQPRTRLVFGVDSIQSIGELVSEYGGKRILLVTDPGIVRAGHAERVTDLITKAGHHVSRFDQSMENPTTECVDTCAAFAKDESIDFIVGLGGGSSMDTAKGCNFILTNGGTMHDYWGVGKATKPMLPLIAVPTTAGTGSECQSFALISDTKTHRKMACGDPKAAAKVAILDASLTRTQPQLVAAHTGIDALSHAVETAVTKKRNPYSWLFSREAFRLIQSYLPEVLKDPDYEAARSGMLLGAAYAGTAIEASMLGAAHALANPLTANHDIVHGQAVGMMLPHVVRFNGESPDVAAIYHELATIAGLVEHSAPHEEAVEAVATRIETILDIAEMPRWLTRFDVPEHTLLTLAEQASEQWTGTFNPREMDANGFETLYRKSL